MTRWAHGAGWTSDSSSPRLWLRVWTALLHPNAPVLHLSLWGQPPACPLSPSSPLICSSSCSPAGHYSQRSSLSTELEQFTLWSPHLSGTLGSGTQPTFLAARLQHSHPHPACTGQAHLHCCPIAGSSATHQDILEGYGAPGSSRFIPGASAL